MQQNAAGTRSSRRPRTAILARKPALKAVLLMSPVMRPPLRKSVYRFG